MATPTIRCMWVSIWAIHNSKRSPPYRLKRLQKGILRCPIASSSATSHFSLLGLAKRQNRALTPHSDSASLTLSLRYLTEEKRWSPRCLSARQRLNRSPSAVPPSASLRFRDPPWVRGHHPRKRPSLWCPRHRHPYRRFPRNRHLRITSSRCRVYRRSWRSSEGNHGKGKDSLGSWWRHRIQQRHFTRRLPDNRPSWEPSTMGWSLHSPSSVAGASPTNPTQRLQPHRDPQGDIRLKLSKFIYTSNPISRHREQFIKEKNC